MKRAKEPKCLRDELINNCHIKILKGDMTRIGGGVFIVPTDSSLSKLPGITSKIIDAVGNKALVEISNIKRNTGSLRPGDIAVSPAGDLQAIRLFHVCIPTYDKNDPEPLVRMFILSLLERSEELQADTICIPCLPKEVFGFLPEQCAYGYLTGINDYLNSHPNTGFKEFRIVCERGRIAKFFEKKANQMFGKKEKKSIFGFGGGGKNKKEKKSEGNNIEMGVEERKNN